MRAAYRDTVPAVAVVFGLVFLLFAGAVYGFHSLMEPTVVKYRSISPYSPASTSRVISETPHPEVPRQERQIKKRVLYRAPRGMQVRYTVLRSDRGRGSRRRSTDAC